VRNLLFDQMLRKSCLFFVAIAAFGRALAAFSVALFAQGMSFFLVEFDFTRGSVAVADFTIFQGFPVSFVIESNIAIFGLEHNGVGGKGGACCEGDEHGGNDEIFHGDFSCGFDG